MARVTHERAVSKIALAKTVDDLMPQLTTDLIRLTRIPSISESTFPPEPVREAGDLVIELLRDAGLQQVKTLDLPGTYPIVIGEIPAPPGAPTVLMYGHYDVVPPGDESKWTTPPFEPVQRNGAIYGRGVSDSKANVIANIGALRAWGGKPPVGIKVIVEGMEEVGSALNQYPILAPEQFRADAMLITDAGSLRPGTPTLTVAVRGMAVVVVEVKTLAGPKHSGQFGGAAPDALIVLLHALASLHDEKGNVTVSGLRREPWTGESYSEAEFRELADVDKGFPLFGSGGLGEHLWSGPAITVTGLDALPVDKAVNAVVPTARARISLRVHPQQDAKEAQAALVAHLKNLRPFGIPLTVTPGATGDGFTAETSGAAYEAGRAALSTAWGTKTVRVATGGSIPLVHALHTAVPEAEILLLGATDGFSNIHAPNERVLVREFRNTALALAEFFVEFSERWDEAQRTQRF